MYDYTFAHFTEPSFILKKKKYPNKKNRSCVQLGKRCQKLDIILENKQDRRYSDPKARNG